MSVDRPGHSDMNDDLDQAYARAHALADDGRGPAAAVRANVLAAAARLAAARREGEAVAVPLVPVAPPVAAVGRGRAGAVNLSSWRLRSGAALCAMLLVGLGAWRFETNEGFKGDVQVALAELRLAEPQTAPAPQDLPLPAAAAASYPYAAPPAVVVDPVDSATLHGVTAKQAARDKELVVAQLEQQAATTRRAAPVADAAARRAPPPAAAPMAPAAPAAADAAPPVVLASNAPRAEAAPSSQEDTTVTVTGAAEPRIVTAPPKAPSVLPRRLMLVPRPASAPAAPPVPEREAVTVAAADIQQNQKVEIAGVRAPSAAPVGDAMKKSAPSSFGSLSAVSARVLPTPLHAAADRGDVETLRKLLANAATPVDAPDAAGRTALLHAVLAQQAGAVRLLLAAGADPARADPAGLSPRAAAQAGASAEIAALLGAPR